MQQEKGPNVYYKEQLIIGLFSCLIGVFTAWDLFVDSGNGTTINHIVLEGFIVLSAFAVFIRALLIFIRREREKSHQIQVELKNEIQLMKNETIQLRADNKKYREDSQKLLLGVGVIIDKQLQDWNLSSSEKEVALFLLKGLSHKEIAEIRNTSEKTIRHHSSQIYSKSNLEGRAQLSAFFLEDLLLPSEKKEF